MSPPAASLLLLAITTLAAHAGGARQFGERELSLGGVRIGQVRAEVVRLHGTPTSITDTCEGYHLAYPGLQVHVGSGNYGVFDIEATGKKICTPAGVCPGTPLAELTAKYGRGTITQRETGTFVEYLPYGSTCWLQVSLTRNLVQKLRVACQP